MNVITKANVRHIHKNAEVANITPVNVIITNPILVLTGEDIIHGIHGESHMFGTPAQVVLILRITLRKIIS